MDSNFEKMTVRALYKFKASNNDEVFPKNKIYLLSLLIISWFILWCGFILALADFQERWPDNCHSKRGWRMVGGYFSRDRKNRMVPFELCQRNWDIKSLLYWGHINQPNKCKEPANQRHDREGEGIRGWDREPSKELLGKNEDIKYVRLAPFILPQRIA